MKKTLKTMLLVPMLMTIGCGAPEEMSDADDDGGGEVIDETTPIVDGKADGVATLLTEACRLAANRAVAELETKNYETVTIKKTAFVGENALNDLDDEVRVSVQRKRSGKWIKDSWLVQVYQQPDGKCLVDGARNETRVSAEALDLTENIDRTTTPGCRFASITAARRIEAQNGGTRTVGKLFPQLSPKARPIVWVSMERPVVEDPDEPRDPEAEIEEEQLADAFIVSTEPSRTSDKGCKVWAIQDVDAIHGPGVLDGGIGDE